MKVTILGDSIRGIGYGQLVPKLLGDAYTVFQPTENCKFAKFTYRRLYDWQEAMEGTDIVHWNNGLWDTCTNRPDPEPVSSPEEYLASILRIAKYLKSKYKVVIFATTTPVRPENPDNDNQRIQEYNSLVVPELKKLGVIINDLNATLIKDIPRFIRDDDLIHLTPEGAEVCAMQVAEAIREAAYSLRG